MGKGIYLPPSLTTWFSLWVPQDRRENSQVVLWLLLVHIHQHPHIKNESSTNKPFKNPDNDVTAWIESSIELIFIKCNDNDLENLAFLFCPIYIKGATLKLQTVPGNISSPSILLCFDWYIYIRNNWWKMQGFFWHHMPWKALKNKKREEQGNCSERLTRQLEKSTHMF